MKIPTESNYKLGQRTAIARRNPITEVHPLNPFVIPNIRKRVEKQGRVKRNYRGFWMRG